MKILALEFSSPRRSVAIVENGTALGEAFEDTGEHTRAFGLIERALTAARLEREQIECVAVGLGPGSYMGIRIAIAIAQGWQLARGVKTAGISSADALLRQAGPKAHAVIDAQRNEFYVAPPLRLATLPDIHPDGLIVGPEVTKWFPNGQVMFPEARVIGALAGEQQCFTPADQLEPIYLRQATFVKAPPPRTIM
jgi:tRNA threonylcarbamoyl adenosine modification protein YeaZ